MEKQRYLVRLVRPVFEVAIVEIEADDQWNAATEALRTADSVEEERWTGRFDPSRYSCDVQYVMAAEGAEGDDYIHSGVEEDRGSLLLKADLDAGEGSVLAQPWMEPVDDLMMADLCMDWGNELEAVREEGVGLYFEGLVRWFESAENRLGKVIPFRRREKDKGQE